jgi:hypothetical protein
MPKCAGNTPNCQLSEISDNDDDCRYGHISSGHNVIFSLCFLCLCREYSQDCLIEQTVKEANSNITKKIEREFMLILIISLN